MLKTLRTFEGQQELYSWVKGVTVKCHSDAGFWEQLVAQDLRTFSVAEVLFLGESVTLKCHSVTVFLGAVGASLSLYCCIFVSSWCSFIHLKRT